MRRDDCPRCQELELELAHLRQLLRGRLAHTLGKVDEALEVLETLDAPTGGALVEAVEP